VYILLFIVLAYLAVLLMAGAALLFRPKDGPTSDVPGRDVSAPPVPSEPGR
jgi:hypothetical protein